MNDALDRLLARDAREALSDEGFTRRVLAVLPARRAHARAWVRPALILGSAALGSALAVALSPGGGQILQGFQDLMQMRLLTTAALTGLGASVALLASAIIFALSSE